MVAGHWAWKRCWQEEQGGASTRNHHLWGRWVDSAHLQWHQWLWWNPTFYLLPRPCHPRPKEHWRTRNINVQGTNTKILTKMPGNAIVYHSTDSLEVDNLHENADDIPDDMLHALDPLSLPLSELMMKIGCPLMLLWNLDPKKGLCNGTCMILLRAYPHILEVMIISSDHHRENAFIPHITLKLSSWQYAFVLKHHQFPVCLCFARTISQAHRHPYFVPCFLSWSTICHVIKSDFWKICLHFTTERLYEYC